MHMNTTNEICYVKRDQKGYFLCVFTLKNPLYAIETLSIF